MELKFWQLILGLLGTGTVSGVLGAIVNGIINRKYRRAQIDDLEASAAQKLIEASGGVLESISTRLAKLEEEAKEKDKEYERLEARYRELKKENADIKRELCLIKKQYEASVKENKILKSRIKLLAKIVTQLVEASDSASCIDDLVNGFQITKEERDYLVEVVEEANNVG